MSEPTTPQLSESDVNEYEQRRYAAVRSYHSGDDVNWFLTVAIPALIRDWRALKAENATLKNHWADTSEDLASALLKHEEQEQSNAALREQLAEAQANVESLSQIIFRNEHATAMRKKCVEKMKDILRPYELEFRRKTNSATNIVDYAAMALESLTLDNVERKQ